MAAPKKKWFHITNNAAGGKAEIKLRGYIGESKEGDWWYGTEGGAGTFKEFEAELEGLGNVSELTVRIFSEGGDVLTGLGIHNLLASHPAHKICIVDGICASAATYALMACDVRRVPANAFVMIHEPETFAYGTAVDMESAMRTLQSMRGNIIGLYADRTGKSPEEIEALVSATTWMNGKEALELGFADEVLSDVAVTNRADQRVWNTAVIERMPVEARGWIDNRKPPTPKGRPTNLELPPVKPTNTTTTTAAPAAPAAPAASATPAAPAAGATTTTATTDGGEGEGTAGGDPPEGGATPAPAAAPVPAGDAATNALAGLITNAVNVVVAPMQAEITNLRAMVGQGVTGAALAGAAPATNVVEVEGTVVTDDKAPPRNRAINAFAKMDVFGGGKKP